MTKEFYIDQNKNGDTWFHLGRFYLDLNPIIFIHAVGGYTTLADAIKVSDVNTGEEFIQDLDPAHHGGLWLLATGTGYRDTYWHINDIGGGTAYFPFVLPEKKYYDVYIYYPIVVGEYNPNLKISIENTVLQENNNYSLVIENGYEYFFPVEVVDTLGATITKNTDGVSQTFETTDNKALDGSSLTTNPRLTQSTFTLTATFVDCERTAEDQINTLLAHAKNAVLLRENDRRIETTVVFQSSNISYTTGEVSIHGTISIEFVLLDGYWIDLETSIQIFNALKAGDAVVAQTTRIVKKDRCSYDPTALYKLEGRLKVQDAEITGSYFLGICGFAEDKITYVNVNGFNGVGDQHYLAAFPQKTTTFETWVGYFSGLSIPGSLTEHPLISNPGVLHNNVYYFSVLVMANYNNVIGITLVDYVKVTNLTTGKVVLYDDFSNYKDETDILQFWDKAEGGPLDIVSGGESATVNNTTGLDTPINFNLTVPIGQDLELAPITIENGATNDIFKMNDSFGPIGKKAKYIDSVKGTIKLVGVDQSAGLAPESIFPFTVFGDNVYTIEKENEDLNVTLDYKRRWYL